MKQIRYRQVHLDFHTSEFIPEVGENFDKEKFAQRLEKSHVDSITCFARCHHGWLYYPSKNFPELIHPNMKNKNLLPEQIEACHQRGIKAPIYTTAQWDGKVMREHKEWLAVDENGEFINTQGIPMPHFYYTICLNSGYRTFFKEHLQDIIDSIGAENVDGLFMDILFQVDCNCESCKTKMRKLSMDTSSKAQRLKYSMHMLEEFKEEITAFIKERVPHATVFYNSSHVGPGTRNSFKDYSHLELESLPSGGWGYDHFPATSRYARTLGKEMIGMTGKFHTYWGDFHSLKNKAALEFECFQMLAMGAGCSIGDQLHPSGALSEGAYDLIGSIYESVEQKECYCKGAKSKAEIAVLTPEEFYPEDSYDLGISPSLIGTVRMLTELAYQFDIVDSRTPLENYKLVILPDCIYYTEELEKVMRAYIEKGGSVIGSYDSCLAKDNKENIYGIQFLKDSPYEREFVMPNDIIGKDLCREEYVMYQMGYDVKCLDAKVLMDKIEPYFNREGETFCSHQHAPSSGSVGCPEAVQNGLVIYFAHPVFKLYRKNAANWCKQIVKDAIELLMQDKLVAHNGPSTVITALNRQEEQNRDVLHILHYVTEKCSEDIYTIEDVIPLYQLQISLYTGGNIIKNVKIVPEEFSSEKEISYVQDENYICFTVDKIEGHCMVAIQY